MLYGNEIIQLLTRQLEGVHTCVCVCVCVHICMSVHNTKYVVQTDFYSR